MTANTITSARCGPDSIIVTTSLAKPKIRQAFCRVYHGSLSTHPTTHFLPLNVAAGNANNGAVARSGDCASASLPGKAVRHLIGQDNIVQAPPCQKHFDAAEAQTEWVIQPDGVTDEPRQIGVTWRRFTVSFNTKARQTAAQLHNHKLRLH